jgi:hypothetical protein
VTTGQGTTPDRSTAVPLGVDTAPAGPRTATWWTAPPGRHPQLDRLPGCSPPLARRPRLTPLPAHSSRVRHCTVGTTGRRETGGPGAEAGATGRRPGKYPYCARRHRARGRAGDAGHGTGTAGRRTDAAQSRRVRHLDQDAPAAPGRSPLAAGRGQRHDSLPSGSAAAGDTETPGSRTAPRSCNWKQQRGRRAPHDPWSRQRPATRFTAADGEGARKLDLPRP